MTTSVHIPYTATLIAPLHHGAGTAGNTSLLRTQRIMRPGGVAASVPYVSGNSLRHQVRDALAWHAVRVLDVGEGSLSKAVVDLLWSGGAITRTGAETDLELLRRVERLYPPLTLLGYSAGSDMVAGVLTVDSLHLACTENAWRLPPSLSTSDLKPAAVYRGDDFGTRHDVAGSAVDRYVEHALGATTTTTQMIYDMQVLLPGAVLASALSLTGAATPAHRRVLAVALDEVMPEHDRRRTIRLAAKTAVGYGAATVDIDLTPLGDIVQARHEWEQHLREYRDEIVHLWSELVA